jgi:hypothetical protein
MARVKETAWMSQISIEIGSDKTLSVAHTIYPPDPMLSPTALLLLSAAIAQLASAESKIPTTSTCAVTTYDGEFGESRWSEIDLEIVPVNLYPDTEVTGPTSLDAVNAITLGVPQASEYGDVIQERFTLVDGALFEANGLLVSFSPVTDLDPNKFGVTESSVLQAGSEDVSGSFCIDDEGYLVSSAPISTESVTSEANIVTNNGDYVANRVKFYACPNYGQSIYGGGDYKIYSNGVLNPAQCVPIYLGAKKVTGTPPHIR